MRKTILSVVTFCALFSQQLFAQPGCPSVTTASNVTIPCGQSCTTLQATAFSAAQTTTYSVNSIAYNPPAAYYAGTPIIVNIDDRWSPAIALPFNFCFFGTSYNSVIVGSNGLVSFNTANAGGFNNWTITGPIPASAQADIRNSIMVWQDMDPTNAGNAIHYQISGTAPCRSFEVSWDSVPMYGDPNSVNTGSCAGVRYYQSQQIVLYETTNAIEIFIRQKGTCTGWNNGRAVEGILNAAGTTAFTVPGRNGVQWTANNDAWQFLPAGAPNFTISWFQGLTQIASTDTVTVCPTSTTVYSAHATYTNCDASQITVTANVTVQVSSLQVNIDSIHPIKCFGGTGDLYASYSDASGIVSFGWSPGPAGQTSLLGVGAGTYIFSVTDSAGCSKHDTVTLTAPPLLQAGIPTNDTLSTCNPNATGSLTIVRGGGTPGYTYIWSNGQTTQTMTDVAGTYTVTVTDANGCSVTASGSIINQAHTITFNAPQITNVTCAGGSNGAISVSTTGGTFPVTYLWSTGATGNSISGLSAIQYCVTATDGSGCTASACYTITAPAQLIASSTNANITSCSGSATGTITGSATGGTPSYTFSWSTGATTTSITAVAGTYTLTVTDANGCTATATGTITVTSSNITFNAPQITNAGCGQTNGSISVSVTGAQPPVTYIWSNGATASTITGLAAGQYCVTATDAIGCSASACYNVTQTGGVVIDSTHTTPVDCAGAGTAQVHASGGSGTYTYLWSNGSTANPVTNASSGTITVTVTDANGCSATATMVVGNIPCPGCPSVVTNHNVSIPCGQSCTELNAGAFSAFQTNTYTGAPTAYAPPVPFNTGTQIIIGIDDRWSNIIPLPFGFCYFGAAYNNAIVGSNGVISFNTANAAGFNSWMIPGPAPLNGNPADLNNCIMGPWQDMDPTNQGHIYEAIVGTAPCRKFIVSWDSVPMYGDPNSVNTGSCAGVRFYQSQQIVIYETTNLIEIFIKQKGTCPGWNGGLAIEGIQNAAGNIAFTVPGRNATQWTANNDGYRFTPAGLPTSTINWYQAGNLIGTGDSIQVCPSTQTVYTIQATYTNCTGPNVTVGDSVTVSPGGGLTLTGPTTVNPTCFGGTNGSASVTVTGATPPVIYTWSNGGTAATITGLGAGQYCVTVTDSTGCSATACATLTAPPQLVGTVANDTVNGCAGTTAGTLTVTATGGTPPYTYVWSNGATTATITGLAAGTYTVTITDANGCTATASGTVSVVGTTITLVPTIVQPTCGQSTGSISVTVTGGTPPVNFIWSNGATTGSITVGGGQYCVTATDANGCSASACYTISQIGSLSIDSAHVTPQDCSGDGTITLFVTGGSPPYTYTWSNGGTGNPLTGLVPGSYTVTVVDPNGCSATATYIVGHIPCPGCPAVITNNNVTQPCGQACTTLTASAFSAYATNTYTVGPVAYNPPFPFTTGTPIIIGIDDRWSNVIPLPFTFCFFGAPYTNAIVGSNGVVSFDIANANGFNTWAIGGPRPGTTDPDLLNCIMGPWQDMDPTNRGIIYQAVVGTYPCRKFVVSWDSVPMFGDPNSVSTAACNGVQFFQSQQIVIYETTNAIDVFIKDKGTCPGWNGGLAVEGIVGNGGTTFFGVPGRNATQWTATNDAWRFTPAGAPTFGITWYNSLGDSIGHGDSILICSDSTQTYGVTATYNNCDGSQVLVSDTVLLTVLGNLHTQVDSVHQISCFGANDGAVYASFTSGSPVISFGWTPGGANQDSLLNLGPGTYIWNVTTTTCTVSDTVTLVSPPQLFVNVPDTTLAGCGVTVIPQLTATVTGGTPAYTYLWSDGQTTQTAINLTAGTVYYVTVTDSHGCTAVDSGTVHVAIGGVTIDSSQITGVGCQGNNGAITVFTTSSAPPVTYIWSNGATGATITGLSSGSYCVTATDASGCSASACYPILQSNFIVIDSANVTAENCAALGSITVFATGGGGNLTYTWSNGLTGSTITGLSGGTYCVTASDGTGCSATACYLVGTIGCPGCPAVVTNNNVSLPCGQACTELTASAFGAFQTTTYTVGQVAYNPPAPFGIGHPIIIGIDDRWSGVIPLPFNFCYFGTSYNQAVVGSNGVVSFDVANANQFNAWTITGTAPTNTPGDLTNAIMGPWQDLDPTNLGNIAWDTVGVYPCRKLIVSWDSVPMYGDPNSVNTSSCNGVLYWQSQMIVMYEMTNVIDIYIKQKGTCPGWNGGLAVEGIQGGGGQFFGVPGRNATQWTANNDAWRFLPAGAPNYTIQWTLPPGGAVISSVDSVNVCPTSTTVYGVSATYGLCGGGFYTVNDSVLVSVSGNLVLHDSIIQPTCANSCNGSIYMSWTSNSAVTAFGFIQPAQPNITSLTNLCPGVYIYSVTNASGCTVNDTITITAPPALVVNVPDTTAYNCVAGGPISLGLCGAVSGGTPGYTYLWSTGETTACITVTSVGTFYLTVTDANGCTAMDSGTVTQVIANPVVHLDTLINGGCNGLGGTITVSLQFATNPITYLWNPGGATTATITGLASGQYCVTATDANQCTASACYNISTAPPVVIDSTTMTQASCTQGGSVCVYASGGTGALSYSWSNGSTSSPCITNVAGGNYCVTITDATGCSASMCDSVTAVPGTLVFGNPVFTNLLCHGDSNACILVTTSGGTPPLTYAWSNGDTTDKACGLWAGTWCITVSDQTGCSATTCYVVTDPPAIIIDSATVTVASCTTPGTICVYASGGTGTLTYSWSNGGTTACLTGLAGGPYSVTIHDANGCSITATYTVPTAPGTVSFLAPTIVNVSCNGGSNGCITANATGGTPPYTYLWSPGGGTTAQICNLTAGNYSVTVSDAVACTASITYIVTQPAAITVDSSTISAATCTSGGSICAFASGGTGTLNYSWSNGGTTGCLTNVSGGPITLTVTDANSCSVTAAFTIPSVSVPLVFDSAQVNNITCFAPDSSGSIHVFVSGGNGTITYQWSPNVGTGAAVTGLAAGTYSVTATDSLGCSASATYVVTSTRLSHALSVSPVICYGTSVGTASEAVTGGTSPYTYTWCNGATTATLVNLPPGFVCVTVTDANGCSAVDTGTIYPTTQLTTTVDTVPNICGLPMGDVTITASGNFGPVTYDIGIQSNNTGVFTGIPSGVYNYTATDSFGCFVLGIFTLPQIATDSFTIHADSTTCFGQQYTDGALTVHAWVNNPAGDGLYQYAINGGATQQDSLFSNLGAGTYAIVVTNSHGCTYNLSGTVEQPAPISVNASPDTVFMSTGNDQILVTAAGFVNPIYAWTPASPDSGLSCNDCYNPIATPDVYTVYYVYVSESAHSGCSAWDSVVVIPSTFVMPNGFTPNGDGKNDIFEPVFPGFGTIKAFRIYNRWGQLIHNAPVGWDGKFNGTEQPTGTYIYYIEATTHDPQNPDVPKTVKQQGSVELIR